MSSSIPSTLTQRRGLATKGENGTTSSNGVANGHNHEHNHQNGEHEHSHGLFGGHHHEHDHGADAEKIIEALKGGGALLILWIPHPFIIHQETEGLASHSLDWVLMSPSLESKGLLDGTCPTMT